MATVQKSIASLASISLGLGVAFHLILSVGKGYAATIFKPGYKSDPLYLETGEPRMDRILFFFTKFFYDTKQTTEGRFVLQSILLLVSAFYFVAAVESTRKTAKGFYRWFGIHSLLSQCIGISITVPSLWLSSYIFTKPNQEGHGPLRRSVVWTVNLSCGLFAVLCVMLTDFKFSPQEFAQTTGLFMVLPSLSSVLWTLVDFVASLRKGPVVKYSLASHQAAKTAQVCYEVVSVMAMIAWFRCVFEYLKPFYLEQNGDLPSTLSAIYQNLHLVFLNASSPDVYPTYFLLIDFFALSFSCLFWASIDSGLPAGLRVAMSSILFGPASALLGFAARREYVISHLGHIHATRKTK